MASDAFMAGRKVVCRTGAIFLILSLCLLVQVLFFSYDDDPPPPPPSLRSASGGSGPPASVAGFPCGTAADIAAQYSASCLGQRSEDIYEHLPLIRELARSMERTTEIGVRAAVSSWAFAMAASERVAAGLPATYRASDVHRLPEVVTLDEAMAGCPSVDYAFVLGNDLELAPWKTDLLFIDTWHVYRQLAAELPRWAPYTTSTILLHDTTLNAEIDEAALSVPKNEALFTSVEKHGLWPAVTDFLNSPAGINWRLKERRSNNNGLTILERVAEEKT